METNLKDKLQKLYTLSKRGVDGEKSNAEVMLRRLLEKHNLTVDDIDAELPKKRIYKYTSRQNRQIICQIVFKILNNDEVYICSDNKVVLVEVTDYQHVQILELIDFHLDKFNKERLRFINDFTSAYIQRHRLFRESTEEEREASAPLTLEERKSLMRMVGIYEMLDEETYVKKIG